MSWLRLQSHSDIGHKFVWLWVSHREPFAKKTNTGLAAIAARPDRARVHAGRITGHIPLVCQPGV